MYPRRSVVTEATVRRVRAVAQPRQTLEMLETMTIGFVDSRTLAVRREGAGMVVDDDVG
jgi:hypothetical protein